MRKKSHNLRICKLISVFIILIITVFAVPNKACATIDPENIQKIFSLGRSVGAAYYHLTDLCDKARLKPYSNLKKEYDDTFQNLNITEIISEDLNINTDTDSHIMLDKLKNDFYNSLKDQDLNQLSILSIKNDYVPYYENLAENIRSKFFQEGSWLLALGFYSSFQTESLNSSSESKLLLSGFDKILNSNPINLPVSILTDLKTVNALDKPILDENEILCLKQNINKTVEFFDNYPGNKAVSSGVLKLPGSWQGVLINPDNQKHNLKLIVDNNMNITMNIDGIAQNIPISDVKLINKYFTFMFKPFGNEKLYIKFNAKITDNIFTGEVVDVLGQKGNWLLSKTEPVNKLSSN